MYKFLLMTSILSLLLFDTFCDSHTYFKNKNYQLFVTSNNIRHSKSRLLKQNEHEFNKYLKEHEHPVRVIRSESANKTQQMEPLVANSQAHISHVSSTVDNLNNSINASDKGSEVNKTSAASSEVFTSDDNAPNEDNMALVTKFLKIVESQHLTGANCTAGTDLNLGENVVDRYAQVLTLLSSDIIASGDLNVLLCYNKLFARKKREELRDGEERMKGKGEEK
ncbi:hypothetical protein M8J76_007196 [Diaphorina citri]|nr:hypothetical protein M8J76_007196 [Diaphorina citri]